MLHEAEKFSGPLLTLVLLVCSLIIIIGLVVKTKRHIDTVRLSSFLSKHHFSNLEEVFKENGVVSLRDVMLLDKEDFKELKISMGDRNRLLNLLKTTLVTDEETPETSILKTAKTSIVRDEIDRVEAYKEAMKERKDHGTSYRKLAKKYHSRGVTKTQLQQRCEGKVSVDAKPGPSSFLGVELELRLLKWVEGMVDRGFPVSRFDINEKARLLCPGLNCSNCWFSTLQKNYPNNLCLRRTERLDRLRAGALNPDVIQHYVDMVATLIEKMSLTPEMIWNMDETGCSMDQTRLYTYCKKGRKKVYASSASNREHISIVSAISASGEYLPEFFIFKGKNDFDALKNANPGADFQMSDKGYMTDEIWPYWVKHFIDCLPPKEERGYVLLVMDGYGSHCNDTDILEIFENHKIICLGLPAHTSSALQPLDVGVFGPFKKALRNAFAKWLRTHPGEPFKKEYFAELVAIPWREAHNKKNVVSSFEKAGLWPHNPDLVKMVCIGVADPLYIPPALEVDCVSPLTIKMFDSIDEMMDKHPEDKKRLERLTETLDLVSPKRKRQEEDPIDVILSYPKRKQPKFMKRKKNSTPIPPPSTGKPDLPLNFYDIDNEEDNPDTLEEASVQLTSFSRLLNGPQRLQIKIREKEQKNQEEIRKKESKEKSTKLEKPIIDLMKFYSLTQKGKNGIIQDDCKQVIRHCKFEISLSLKRDELVERLSPICEETLTSLREKALEK
eukprot:Lithocolla_globosa_v1_NODE_1473_length_2545_cov_53.511647.p1 type:complete len:727 gc:universal NODE_1473_length_2545_cov_53.511647:192-2372(+)